GVDAAAIGNHEFDWTVDTLRARMAEAHYRFLAANITDSAGTARPDWAEPFTVIARDGVRVAVIGLALPATPETTSPRNVRGLAFGDGARAVRRVLPQARAAGDYVIVVAHVAALRLSQASVSLFTDRPVARFGTELRRTGAEHGLGRLIADAQRNIAKADVALVNNGGIRADVSAGLATYGDLYRVEPFQN